MIKVMRACIILHNMIVEDQRQDADPHEHLRDDAGNIPAFIVTRPSFQRHPSVGSIMTTIMDLENEKKYFELLDDLVDHLWNEYAEER